MGNYEFRAPGIRSGSPKKCSWSFFQIQRDKTHCHWFWAAFRYPFLGLFLASFFHKPFPVTRCTPLQIVKLSESLKYQWIDSSQALTRRFNQALDQVSQGVCSVSITGEAKNLSNLISSHLILRWPCHELEAGLWPDEISLILNYLVVP